MEQEPQAQLDQQVQQALQELEAAGEPSNVESVARVVRRRTADVLAAMKRLTEGPPAVDVDTDPEDYPEVVTAARKVETITAALHDAERTLHERETLLARAEVQAAEALLDGRELVSLDVVATQVGQALDTVRLLVLAATTAKSRHAQALAQAQAQHWAAQWQRYQGAVQAFDAALAVAFEAQEQARLVWNEIGQPGEVPMLKGPLSMWEPHFHSFLQEILSTEASDVRRGSIFAPEAALPPRAY